MNTLVSIRKHDGESVQIEAINGPEVLTLICKHDQIVNRLIRIQVKMWWKTVSKWMTDKI